MRRGRCGVLLVAVAALPLVCAAADRALPLEEKAKFEKALEEKAESVLLRILGPNRYKVVVDATLDFTRIERFDVTSGAAVGGDKSALFLWQNVGAEGAGRSQLLPGIPSPEAVPDIGGTRSYKRENAFPANFVKRLNITLILDQTLREQGDAIGKIVQDVLGAQPSRGDVFDIAYAPFAPAYKTIWYTPETASLLFKYGLISLMTLITLIVVAACFLKLAEAMDSMAQAQSTQMSLDTGGGGAGGEEGEEGEKDGDEEAAPESQAIFFNVNPDQIETLLEILHGQDSENVALVVAHLKPEVKKKFLARLPTQIYTQVLMNMGKIKFIEPDTVMTVKEELERRLESAVGGHGKLLDLIEESDQKSKRELLKLLRERDQDLARLVRSRVLLFEDLVYLEPREWSILLSGVRMEDWAPALHETDQRMIDAIKGQMLPKTWQILEQIMTFYQATEEASEEARERIVKIAGKLMEDGRLGNPVERRVDEPIAVSAEPPPLEEAPPPMEDVVEAGK